MSATFAAQSAHRSWIDSPPRQSGIQAYTPDAGDIRSSGTTGGLS